MSDTPRQNSTFDALWAGLTPIQRKYVVARQEYPTKTAAAEAIGVDRTTVYRWPDDVERCVELLQEDAVQNARAMLEQAVTKAVLGKIEEMDSSDALIAARARTEIQDRVMGKPTQRQEVQHEGTMQVESESLSSVLDALKRRAGKLD